MPAARSTVMLDMSTWPELRADVVDELHLDPRNVRLDLESPESVPETDIIQDLFTNEKAFSLVEAIAQNGYFNHELPVVLVRDGLNIVVEGNRRLAALKAIQNPYLVPDYRARIAKYVEHIPNRDSLKEITVKVAPSQDDADQLIAALHTGAQRVAWSPTRQAAFFQAQIDAGKTLSQLVAQYPNIDVRDFVVRSKMLDLFRSANYPDPALKDYVSRRRFPVSTLARLYEYDKFLELAQIVVNQDKARVTLSGTRTQFSLLAEKIISDIKNKRIDTRVLNSTQSVTYQDYMRELRDFVNEPPQAGAPTGRPTTGGVGATKGAGRDNQPQGSSGSGATGAGGPATGEDAGSQATEGPVGAAKAKPTSKVTSLYLDTNGLDAAGYPPAISYILGELSSINVNRFPNAAFDLLRTFLEKSLKAYADKLNEEIKNTANQNGYVQLSHALIWIEQLLKANGPTALVQVVAKLRSGKVSDFISSKSHLDAINHNHLIFATTSEVKECWNTMKPLLQHILKP
jgi:hypothetical protein